MNLQLEMVDEAIRNNRPIDASWGDKQPPPKFKDWRLIAVGGKLYGLPNSCRTTRIWRNAKVKWLRELIGCDERWARFYLAIGRKVPTGLNELVVLTVQNWLSAIPAGETIDDWERISSLYGCETPGLCVRQTHAVKTICAEMHAKMKNK